MNKSTNNSAPEALSQGVLEKSKPLGEVQPYQSNPFYLCFDDLGTFFEKNIWWVVGIVGSSLLMGLMSLISNFIELLINSTSENAQAMGTAVPDQPVQIVAILGIMAIVAAIIVPAMLIGMAIQTFIGGAFAYVSLVNHAGRSVGFSETFDAVAKRFWRLFFAQLLASLKIIAWTFLLIIPGIIAALRYALLPYVIMDESIDNKGVVDSHNRTKNLVAGRKFEVFGIMVVSGIIPIIGQLLQLTGSAKLYRQLQVFYDGSLRKPKVHWLNYVGLIYIVLMLLAAILVIILIAIVLSSNK